MVEYNISSDTRQDKNDGSQYGDYNYITSDTGKDKTDWTLDKKIKMISISMDNYNITSDTGQDKTEWQ